MKRLLNHYPLIRIPLFMLLLIVAQGVISMLFPVDLPAEIVQFEQDLKDGVDVLYLGDSTLMLPVGEVTTGEILQEFIPDQRIGQVAHPAYGLNLFYDYVSQIPRHEGAPKTLVVPINLRSFSPAWDMNPAYQFEKESKILGMGQPLARLLLRPLEIFGYFQPSISQETFLNTPVYDGDARIGQVRDFETLSTDEVLQKEVENAYREVALEDEETARAVLTYHYMFKLDPDHRKLDAMVAIAKQAAERGMRVIFYITPVNVEQGERFLGPAFTERFTDNIHVVQSRIAEAGLDNVTLLNLAYDLPAYNLTDTEHLTETGKEAVAEQIAQSILQEDRALTASAPDASPTATALPTLAPTATAPTPGETELVATPTADATPTVTTTPEPVITGGNVTDATYIDRFWPSGPYPVDMYRITFETVDEFDALVETQADLYIPYVESDQAFPVLGHAAGTTGIGNDCAPLDERQTGRAWGGYHSQSLVYAAQGYIVIYPNWLHFEDPDRIHHYFVSEFQAHTLLDAVRAAYRFWDLDQDPDTQAMPAETAFMMGYSSGGHAVFAAKDYAQAYAPELPIKGAIGFGPVTNPGLLLQEDPVFGPYIVYAYRDFYGEDIIDPAEVYVTAYASDFDEEVPSICVDEIFYAYSHSARQMYEPDFREALYDGQLDAIYPEFAEKLTENRAGFAGERDIPVLILQGTADTVVTPPSQEAFVEQLCAQGNTVTLNEYIGASHGDTRGRSYRDVLSWMDDIVQGNAPESDCASLE